MKYSRHNLKLKYDKTFAGMKMNSTIAINASINMKFFYFVQVAIDFLFLLC